MKKWTVGWAVRKYGVTQEYKNNRADIYYKLGPKMIYRSELSRWYGSFGYINNYTMSNSQLPSEAEAVRWLVEDAEPIKKKKWELTSTDTYIGPVIDYLKLGLDEDSNETKLVMIKKTGRIIAKYYKKVQNDNHS
jgi:hypothetical protein